MPNLRAELSAQGVGAARVRAWPLRDRQQHLARAAAATLSLDSPGYNQGTSGLDALWAGLPLVSLPLSKWCGRMGLGLLRGVAQLPGAVRSRREMEDLVLHLARPTVPSTNAAAARRMRLTSPTVPQPASIEIGRSSSLSSSPSSSESPFSEPEGVSKTRAGG